MDKIGPAMDRRHDLDALRAAAMLLGLAYHAALSFAAGMPWLVQDVRQTRWLYLFQAAVHGFRMPLFFLISGFFTTMLWRKRGLKALIWNRFRRILLPCLLGLITIVPAMNWVSGKALESGFRKQVEAAWARPDGPDLWTAAAAGDTGTVARLLAEGADVNGRQAAFGVTPLTTAALVGQTDVAGQLLDGGADINGRNRDGGTALHAAAFLGRTGMVDLLIQRGADVRARNNNGETSVNAALADWPTTQYIAGLFRIAPTRDQVESGRAQIIERLKALGVDASPVARPGGDEKPEVAGPGPLRRWIQGLIDTPVFILVWFLWFLCWLISGFSIYAILADRYGWKAPPKWLMLSPANLLLLIPLTMVSQWFMESSSGGFGPDTSMGIIPMPRVFTYYALFFWFGVLYYECDDATGLLGRHWRLTLPASLFIVFPLSLEFATGTLGFRDSLLPARFHHLATVVMQVLYAWLMTFGCMGMFRSLLTRESKAIRYLSDSAYWLYLAHLPVIIAVQILVRDLEFPAIIKCSAITLAITGVLLLVYDTMVRYTWLGTLLNGPRRRKTDPS